MSRSSSATRSRRRSSRSSCCSLEVSPSASLASTAACLRHSRNVSALTPSSTATSFHRSPRCSDSRTASARNSGGYGLRKFGTPTPLLASTNPPIVEVSTEPGQAQQVGGLVGPDPLLGRVMPVASLLAGTPVPDLVASVLGWIKQVLNSLGQLSRREGRRSSKSDVYRRGRWVKAVRGLPGGSSQGDLRA